MIEYSRKAYEQSLKTYLDLKNIIETARTESEAKGENKKALEIGKLMKEEGFNTEIIKKLTGFSQTEIENL